MIVFCPGFLYGISSNMSDLRGTEKNCYHPVKFVFKERISWIREKLSKPCTIKL